MANAMLSGATTLLCSDTLELKVLSNEFLKQRGGEKRKAQK
jgi:hypothetical protein